MMTYFDPWTHETQDHFNLATNTCSNNVDFGEQSVLLLKFYIYTSNYNILNFYLNF